MSRELFERRYQAAWRELEGLYRKLEIGQGRRVAAPELARLPALYRQVCHQLALARHRRYGGHLERQLERLALSGHQVLYEEREASARHDAGTLREALVREKGLILLSVLLFTLPAIATAVAVLLHPDLAASVLPAGSLDEMARQFAPDGSMKAGRAVDSDVLMFGFYIHNNIGIAFRTFAGGILFGIGSLFFTVYNGIVMGAVAAQIHLLGYETTFYSFVIGHGAFELTAIVLAAAAGLRLGHSLLAPGRLTRGRALVVAARRSVKVLYLSAAMLVVAAFLEAFWSSSTDVPPAVKLSVGAVFWVVVIGSYVRAVRGRRPA